MMREDAKKALLEEMVSTETNMENLYRFFASRFADDKEFWEQIRSEEGRHAAILLTGELYLAFNVLPDAVLLDRLEELRRTNASIERVTAAYKREPPAKDEAYNYAIQMEKSLSEAFFQELLAMKHAPEIVAVWQKLGADSIDHSNRIRRLLP